MEVGEVWLVYDGECPICRTYARYARVNAAVGRLHLVDARQPGALMDEVTAAGLAIDEGTVLKFRDVIFYGADAVRVLGLLSTGTGWFNRLSYAFFGNARRASVFYPVVRGLRKLLLRLLGIPLIENLGPGAVSPD